MPHQSIALSPTHPSFFELDLRTLSPEPFDIDVGDIDVGDIDVGDIDAGNAALGALVEALCDHRLLLLHHDDAHTAIQWARRLAHTLADQTELPVLEWQGFADGGFDALDVNELLAVGEGANVLTAPAILLVPHFKGTGLAEWFGALQPVLEARNQYLFFTTALPQPCWQLTHDAAEHFWCACTDLDTQDQPATKPEDERGAPEKDAATADGAEDDIVAFYAGLARSDQLSLLGLCLFGELRDDHFFAAMERLMDRAWPDLRADMGLFDFADLVRIEPLLRYIDVLPAHTKIEHVMSNQRRLILTQMRRTHWHHLRVALPVLGDLLEEWLADGSEAEYAYIARAATEALSDLAQLYPGLLADLLWQLAASESIAVRTVAARVLAGEDPEDARQQTLYHLLQTWVEALPEPADEVDDKAGTGAGEGADAGAAWDSPAQRVRQTAAHAVALAAAAWSRCLEEPTPPTALMRVRDLLQAADEPAAPSAVPLAVPVETMPDPAGESPAAAEGAVAASAPEPAPALPPSTPSSQASNVILEMARRPELHDTVVDILSGSREIDEAEGEGGVTDVLRNWQARAAYERESEWLPVAFAAARANFHRTLGADELYDWLAYELIAAPPEAYALVVDLLPRNQYLYAKVLPNHLSPLSDLLLYLAQDPAQRNALVELFTDVYAQNPRSVQETLEKWYTRWQIRHESQTIWQQVDWDAVRDTQREICQHVDCSGWYIWTTEPLPNRNRGGADAASEDAGSESTDSEEPVDGRDAHDELADLTGLVTYAGRGDAERAQVIDRFLGAYRNDPSATQNRINALQIEALQKLQEDPNSSVEGLGLIGIIRDRIEEIEDHDA